MRLPSKVFLVIFAGLAGFAFPRPCSGRLYPKYFRGRYKVTKYDMESLVDGKMVAAQPDGGSVFRNSEGNAVVFFTDPSGGRIQFQKFCDAQVDTIVMNAFGGWGTGDGNYKLPHQMVIWDGSDIYIADAGNDRIARAVFDSQNFSVSSSPPIGTEAGLALPHGVDVCHVDGVGIKVYVADTDNHRIVRLSEGGSLEAQYGSYGSGQGQFNHPQAVAKHGDFVYVADTYNGRVVALLENPNGSFDWWASYSPSEDLPLLVSVACDTSGNVFVLDKAYCRVVKLSTGLTEFLRSEGTRGIYSAQFLDPRGISISKPSNDVLIVESWTDHSGLRLLGNRVDIMEKFVTPSSFDASEEETEVSFKIDDVATVTVDVVTEGSQLVRTLVSDTLLPAGTHQGFVCWDGRDDEGRLALPGSYYVRVTAHDTYGGSDVEPIPVTVEGTVVEGGNLSDTHEWIVGEEPYVLTGDVWVQQGATLDIEPGVKVMFWPHGQDPYSLLVGGTLQAVGVPGDSVVFTSYKKSDERVPGDWGALYFSYSSSDCILDTCIVEFGGGDIAGPDGSILVWFDATPLIRSNRISESSAYGVYCQDYGGSSPGRPVMTENVFVGNAYYPVRVVAEDVGEVSTTNTFLENGEQAIQVIGAPRAPDIATSATWARCDVGWRYDVEGEITVASASSPVLTIEPGVTLRFPDDLDLNVGRLYPDYHLGGLCAVGKPDSLITFTSYTSGPGSWGTIYFRDATMDDESELDYCLLEFGGGSGSMISMSNSSPTLRRSIITRGPGSGIQVSGLDASPAIIGCTISENEESGILCADGSAGSLTKNEIKGNDTGVLCLLSGPAAHPTINYNNICGNTAWGVRNLNAAVTVDAKFNWWGHASGPYDPSQGPPGFNPEGQGDSVSDYVDYSDWLRTPLIFCEDPEATAWNNSHKIACYGSEYIHFVYQSGGEIHYRYSSDAGESWEEDYVLGEGETPAIAINPITGYPGVVWIGPEELPEGRWLYYAGYAPGYNPPWRVYPLVYFGGLVRPYLPSFQVDPQGYGHLVWEEEPGMPQSNWWRLNYGLFCTNNPDSVATEQIDGASECGWRASPSIVLDSFNSPHVVWRKGPVGEIYYSTRDYCQWTTPQNISGSQGAESAWPSLNIRNDCLSVVWQEEIAGASEIVHKGKTIGAGWWGPVEQVTHSAVDSYHPVVIAGAAAVWAETVDGSTDIFWSAYQAGVGWTVPEPLKTTPGASMYPHMAALGTGSGPVPWTVWLCWTEGDSAPYFVELEVAPFSVPEGKGGSYSGHITADTHWKTDVHLTGDLWVDPRVTLTIEPGVRVQVAARSDDQESGADRGRSELIVLGSLKIGVGEADKNESSMAGSEEKRVVFTSDAPKPAPGDWYGIRFPDVDPQKGAAETEKPVPEADREETAKDGGRRARLSKGRDRAEKAGWGDDSSAHSFFEQPWATERSEEIDTDVGVEYIELKGCWVGYAVRGISLSGDRSLELRDWVFTRNHTGVHCAGSASPVLRENAITENTHFGVYLEDSAGPNFGEDDDWGHNRIHSNGKFDLYNDTRNRIPAELNYWGTLDPEEISSHIWHGQDDPSLGVVDFQPFWDPEAEARGGAQSAGRGLGIPKVFALHQNAPNPFSRTTLITYGLAPRHGDAATRRGGDVSTYQHINLCVYDLTGRLVRTVVDEVQEPGYYRAVWNGKDSSGGKVSSGVYFYRLAAGSFEATRKLLVLR